MISNVAFVEELCTKILVVVMNIRDSVMTTICLERDVHPGMSA